MDECLSHTSRLFEALSHRYRRIALYYLREHESATPDALADATTGWVQSGPGASESADYERVRLALHHVHLPILEEAGLVEDDRDDGTVALTEFSATARRLVDAALEAETSGTPPGVARLLAAVDDGSGSEAPGGCGDAEPGPSDGAGDGDGG